MATKVDKKNAIRQGITEAEIVYFQNLAGKTFLYVCGDEYFEASFPRPFLFSQLKPMRMFIMTSILTDDTMPVSSIKNHASLKYTCHLLASPKFVSFVHRLFLLKLG